MNSEEVRSLMEEKKKLNNILKHFNYFFENEKTVIKVLLGVPLLFIFFFNTSFYNNFLNNPTWVSVLWVVTLLFSALVFVFYIGVMLDSRIKVVFKKENYINNKLNKSEVLLFKKLIVNYQCVGINNYDKVIRERIKKIDKMFSQKSGLEGLYQVISHDKEFKNNNRKYFLEKLKEYNKKQQEDSVESEEINKELEAAGFKKFDVSFEELDLKISEHEI